MPNCRNEVNGRCGQRSRDLQQATLGKGQAAIVAHDAMIEHADIDQCQRLTQPARDELIGLTGFGHPRRMIVREYYRSRVATQGLLDHLTRMHARAIYRAAKQFIEGDQSMTIVEVQTAKQLIRLIAQAGDEKAMGGSRGVEQRAGAQRLGVVSARQFERGLQTTVPGRTQAAQRQQRCPVSAEQLPQ